MFAVSRAVWNGSAAKPARQQQQIEKGKINHQSDVRAVVVNFLRHDFPLVVLGPPGGRFRGRRREEVGRGGHLRRVVVVRRHEIIIVRPDVDDFPVVAGRGWAAVAV